MLNKDEYVAKPVRKYSLSSEELEQADRIPQIETSGDQISGNYIGNVMGFSLEPVYSNKNDGLSEIRLKGVEFLISKFNYSIENSVFRSLADTPMRTKSEPGYFLVKRKPSKINNN